MNLITTGFRSLIFFCAFLCCQLSPTTSLNFNYTGGVFEPPPQHTTKENSASLKEDSVLSHGNDSPSLKKDSVLSHGNDSPYLKKDSVLPHHGNDSPYLKEDSVTSQGDANSASLKKDSVVSHGNASPSGIVKGNNIPTDIINPPSTDDAEDADVRVSGDIVLNTRPDAGITYNIPKGSNPNMEHPSNQVNGSGQNSNKHKSDKPMEDENTGGGPDWRKITGLTTMGVILFVLIVLSVVGVVRGKRRNTSSAAAEDV